MTTTTIQPSIDLVRLMNEQQYQLSATVIERLLLCMDNEQLCNFTKVAFNAR